MKKSSSPTFADITTMQVGGTIHTFLEPTHQDEFLAAVQQADNCQIPLCIIGGGSNMLVSDEPFQGTVIRYCDHTLSIVEDRESHVLISVGAGYRWDDFVQYCVDHNYAGVEALSGVPGTVGASVVQNIGAYGQEVSQVVDTVVVWDREQGTVRLLTPEDMRFGYRTSLIKQSMNHLRFAFSPQYIVLTVLYRLRRSDMSPVAYSQLANALQVSLGETMPIATIRNAVLTIRAKKGMLEDMARYDNPYMRDYIPSATLHNERIRQEASGSLPDYNRHSCGSFFVNPIIHRSLAEQLPDDAPRFPVSQEVVDALGIDGAVADDYLKTSAAWLIDHAGFHVGFAVSNSEQSAPKASLSTVHTLALTNRGGATSDDIVILCRAIQQGVHERFGIWLVPEPVCIGFADEFSH